MGTSLNGLTPASTYQGLIKTTDNAAISGTAKFLSDGLGNDSPLSMSTSSVGIGTTTLNAKLKVSGSAADGAIMSEDRTSTTSFVRLLGDFSSQNLINWQSGTSLRFATSNQDFSSFAEAMRITSAGNVGIGTITPPGKLTVVGSNSNTYLSIDNAGSGENYFAANSINIFQVAGVERARITSNGLSFNGDTAAANALDDYEEGTWTATLTPSTSGTITLSDSTSTYTKIGNQVTVKSKLVVSSVATPIGTITEIGGLPFTIQNSQSARGSFSVAILDASLGYTAATYPTQHSANVTTLLIYVNSSLIEADDEILFTATYFV
jgi:hypothetical protein